MDYVPKIKGNATPLSGFAHSSKIILFRTRQTNVLADNAITTSNANQCFAIEAIMAN
jgi:hypothetical protein